MNPAIIHEGRMRLEKMQAEEVRRKRSELSAWFRARSEEELRSVGIFRRWWIEWR
jgi:hypothetical protein